MPKSLFFSLDIRLMVSTESSDADVSAIRDCVLTALLNSCPLGWAPTIGAPTVHLEDVDIFSVTPDRTK